MPIAIRRAVPQDAQAIVDLIAAAFQEEANAAHIQALIEEGEHLTFVAEAEKVVGFIDGFYTLGAWDLRRLELDLLAVHPEHSGKGIGKKLIQTFTEAQENAAWIRALVAADNTPMQAAMKATGYRQAKVTSSLYIASEGASSQAQAINSLIPVKTFTYTGIWMEGAIFPDSIEAAHYLREQYNYEIVGAVMSDTPFLEGKVKILKEANFQFIKQFHWWTRTIITEEQFSAHQKKWEEEHGD